MGETEEILQYWMKKDWEEKGIGYYIICELSSDSFIGYGGLSLREFNNTEMLNLAYRINPEFQRKGIVFEACTVIIKEAEKVFPDMIIKVAKRNNVPSFKPAQKPGFIYHSEYDDYPEKDDVYLFNVPYKIKQQL
ncbi:MAG: GNAT family N-acetyltransferase [Leptotrichiaceae bacterium]|nr:GNAT family N-acetyltransferase [Leptotrichiaceae bacterium]